MSYRITPTNVRNRLKNLTSVDITDAQLEDIAYIPVAEARIDEILSANGLAYSTLSTNAKKTIVCAAQIELAAMVVLIEAPTETFETVGRNRCC